MTEEKKKLDNVIIWPLLKKNPQGEINFEEITEEEIKKIARHYMEQLVFACKNHGVKLDGLFYKDFNLVYESFISTLMRASGKYHIFQENVDWIDETSKKIDEESEKNED